MKRSFLKSALGLCFAILAGLFLAVPAGLQAEVTPFPYDMPERHYPNILYNGSFETINWFDFEYAEKWGGRGSRPLSRWRETRFAHTGEACYMASGGESGVDRYDQQVIRLVPDTDYVLSVYALTTTTLSGNGIQLQLYQIEPSPVLVATTSYMNDATTTWTRFEASFTAPSSFASGVLRIRSELAAGDLIMIDDIQIVPAGGASLPVAPVPTFVSPAAGSHVGPQYVTLSTTVPDAEIRYTVDGSDPNIYSTQYLYPFWLGGDGTVKARVFHNGYEDSPVASRTFDIQPEHVAGAVPFFPVGYDQTVDDWWDEHHYNPASPNFIPLEAVTSNTTAIINVDDARTSNPGTTTGGIAEALALLPPEGGTLWFPASGSPYVITEPTQEDGYDNLYDCFGSVLILEKSNIHFVSNGAVIEGQLPDVNGRLMFGFESNDFHHRHTLQVPSRNFLFQNIIFDGGWDGTTTDTTVAYSAFLFRHTCDVLFQECTFQNFKRDPGGVHGAYINASSKSDNIWMRNCDFIGDAQFQIYLDGTHNSGAVNCTFETPRGVAALFTNNDVANWSAEERTIQYFVMNNCDITGGSASYVAIAGASMANCLFSHNRVRGPFATFFQQIGRGESSIVPYLRYSGLGLSIHHNVVEDCTMGFLFDREVAQWSGPEYRPTQIYQNGFDSIKSLMELHPYSFNAAFPTINIDNRVERIEVFENDFNSTSALTSKTPQVRVQASHVDHISSITLYNNHFGGSVRDALVDTSQVPSTDGNPTTPTTRVRFFDNTPVPAAPNLASLTAGGLTSVTATWTDNADDEWGFRFYFGKGADPTIYEPVEVVPSATAAPHELEALFRGLDSATTYTFSVSTWYPFYGESALTTPVSVMTWEEPEEQPELPPANARYWSLY